MMKVVLVALAAVALAGCSTRSQAAYEKSKAEYQACVQAKGASGCAGEKAVMDNDAAIYANTAISGGRPSR